MSEIRIPFASRNRLVSPARRAFLKTGAAAALVFGTHSRSEASACNGLAMDVNSRFETDPTLLTAPIELVGDWGHMIPASAQRVVEYARHACLDDVRLLSERQPSSLKVEEHISGSPSVWLHDNRTAWVIVDVGERDWSRLAYQFGHELGHVMANSWQLLSKPSPPCQWIEEALVESFSIRGLGHLAEKWKTAPPFAGDNAFGASIADYRQKIIAHYSGLADQQGLFRDRATWFTEHRSEIEVPSLNPFAQAASVLILAEYERRPACVEAIGALNRWPGRSGLPIHEYFRQWEASCVELKADPELPKRLRQTLGITPA